MLKHAIFLSGPVGVGKTTLGHALAPRIGGCFIDGDDHSDPDKPWYCSILRTSRAILQAAVVSLEDRQSVVIAYPLNCIAWIYFKRKFEQAGIRTVFVGLRASYSSIVAQRRGRAFSVAEQRRIAAMIAEGYGAQFFCDVIVDTDTAGFADILARLEAEIRRIATSHTVVAATSNGASDIAEQ